MSKTALYLGITSIILILVLAGTTGILFFQFQQQKQQLSQLNQNLQATVDSLQQLTGELQKTENLRKEDQAFDARQRELLKNETVQNFKQLLDFYNDKTAQLKLNLESQLTGVATSIEEAQRETERGLKKITKQVGGLEGKISELNVQSTDFSAIIEEVIQAVVSIRTNTGQGSGVFYDSEGYILTNKHVIEGADRVSVVDYTGKAYAVQLVGTAQQADLAVLKIQGEEGAPFTALSFAEEDPHVGTRVIGVGNPLGLSFSVTEGIISAVNRQIDNTGIGYIQTDVSINPGNSGGPLVNPAKQIVGINTLKARGSEGIGFAIPARLAQEMGRQAKGG